MEDLNACQHCGTKLPSDPMLALDWLVHVPSEAEIDAAAHMPTEEITSGYICPVCASGLGLLEMEES